MDFEEFERKILKKQEVKDFKVRNSWGTRDAFKAIRRAGWYGVPRPLKEHEFYAIIRQVNDLLAKEIELGHTVKFPQRMGKLELRKSARGPKIKNGKLKVTYPINWRATIQLWYEDPEALRDKTLVRIENPEVYRVKYCKNEANYENKKFYQFVLNRFIKRALTNNIKAGITDTMYNG